MFEGKLPATIYSLQRLEKLYLSDNSLSRVIPHQIIELTRISHLWLDGNNFSGTFPGISVGEPKYLGELLNTT